MGEMIRILKYNYKHNYMNVTMGQIAFTMDFLSKFPIRIQYDFRNNLDAIARMYKHGLYHGNGPPQSSKLGF